MSHMNTYQANLDSIEALKDACRTLKLTFREGKTTARYYRGQEAPCLHAIELPNTTYEVGVVQGEQQGTYALMMDEFDRNVTQAVGPKGSQLVVQHNVAKSVRAIQASGLGTVLSMTPMENGGMRMVIREY